MNARVFKIPNFPFVRSTTHCYNIAVNIFTSLFLDVMYDVSLQLSSNEFHIKSNCVPLHVFIMLKSVIIEPFISISSTTVILQASSYYIHTYIEILCEGTYIFPIYGWRMFAVHVWDFREIESFIFKDGNYCRFSGVSCMWKCSS